MRMAIRNGAGLMMVAAGLAAALPASAFEPVEQVKSYAIAGQTGAELYAAIGAKGPLLNGGGRAVAHTTFKLTWRRDYRPQPDGSCVLAGAVPKLVITYTLPKPSQKLGPDVAASWKRFADGLSAHEKVHGRQIVDMVTQIAAVSVGITAPADRDCNKVRAILQGHLKELSDARVAESREFDRVEMGDGGAVHRLILGLVNGP